VEAAHGCGGVEEIRELGELGFWVFGIGKEVGATEVGELEAEGLFLRCVTLRH